MSGPRLLGGFHEKTVDEAILGCVRKAASAASDNFRSLMDTAEF